MNTTSKTYNETLRDASNLGYTHIEIDGQLRDIGDIIAIAGEDGDTGAYVLDADSIERLNADGIRTGESYRLAIARPLLLIPAVTLCDAGFGDLDDAGIVYETAADARAHLADQLSEMDSAHDEQLIERVVAAAVTLDNPTADQLAEAAAHRR